MKLARLSLKIRNAFLALVFLTLMASQLGLVKGNEHTRISDPPVSTHSDGTAPNAVPFPPNGKTVTVALPGEPDLVDSIFSSMSYSAWVDQSVLVGLGTWDANNNLVPELATVIPSTANGGISTDGLTITWHLKPDLYWSDGSPLTSADVKFTWQVETDPGNAVYSRAGYDQIGSIDTPDATTAVLHFNSLYPGWPTLFTSGPNNQGNLQPMHILQGKTGLESDSFVHWPTVSSGPWVISEWVAGDHMTLLPNANYWRGHPKLDQIVIKFISDPAEEKAALMDGSVDYIPGFQDDLSDLASLEPAVHSRVEATSEFEHYFFNLGVKGTGTGQSDMDGFCPFKNVAIRKAIILGIDRQSIVDTYLFGKTTVPASLWPNSSWYDTSLTPYPYDPVQARTLLDAAGYTVGDGGIRHGMCNGVDTVLSFDFETTTRQLREDIGNAVQTMLLGIGIAFNPIYTPAGTFFGGYNIVGANMPKGNFDMAGYTTGFYPDPYTDNFLCATVTSNQNQGGDNNYHLCDAALDTLFQQAQATADPAARKVIFDQIQQYMYDNALVIPMYAQMNIMAYGDTFILPPTSSYGGMMDDTFDWNKKSLVFLPLVNR